MQEITSFLTFSQKNIFALLNSIRFYFPFLLVPILIILFFSTKVKRPSLIVSLFFVYFCWQLFAFFYSERFVKYSSNILSEKIHNTASLWDNLHLIFCSISVLLVISIARNLDLKKFIKKILIISLIFVGMIALYFTYSLMSESLVGDLQFIYKTATLDPSGSTLGQPNPRITGVSRLILIFYFLVFSFLLNKNRKIVPCFILIILGLIIYKMQTRGSFFGIFLVFILFFVFNSTPIKKKIIILTVVLLAPILLFEAYYKIKYSELYAETTQTQTQTQNAPNRLATGTTSGRTQIWKNALSIINEKKIILGYGPQADRFLLTYFLPKHLKPDIYKLANGKIVIYDNNASNAALYAYLCGGILGFLLIISIYILAIATVIKNIFIKKIFLRNNIFQTFSTILLIYLGFRGLYENSFSLFGVDYIFFILSYIMAENRVDLTKNI